MRVNLFSGPFDTGSGLSKGRGLSIELRSLILNHKFARSNKKNCWTEHWKQHISEKTNKQTNLELSSTNSDLSDH